MEIDQNEADRSLLRNGNATPKLDLAGQDGIEPHGPDAVMNSSPSWVQATTGDVVNVSRNFCPLANRWHDIANREKRLGITPGMPVLVSGALVDDRLGLYFRQAFSRDRVSTAKTYAIELRMWLAFLTSRDVRWDEARREDVRAFQLWRVYDDQNIGRVSPATWNKGWAAIRHFYDWASREHWVEDSPVGDEDRLRNPSEVGGYKEKHARSSRDRWLTPEEFGMWRDVGMRGYQAALQDPGKVVADMPSNVFRGRNSSRNSAYADFVLSTGLRSAEAGSLLEMEIPARVGDKAPIVAKGGVFRHYVPLYRRGLESVQAYRHGERRDAIRRAQSSRRYDNVTNRLDIIEILPGGRQGQRVRIGDDRIVNVPWIANKDRLRLFVPGPRGPEPAALWLTDAGDPMPHTTWNSVFNAANARVTTARAGAGIQSPWVHVTPHSLRFTFALMVLVAGVRATDERLGTGPEDAFLVGNYSHVFDEVRDLLGHASVVTTKSIYLEPVKSLRRSVLFHGESAGEMWDGLAAESPLVGFQGFS